MFNSSPVSFTGAVVCSALVVPFLLKKPEYSILFIAAILPFRDVHITSIVYLKRFVIWALLVYILLRYLSNSSQKFSSHSLDVFNKIVLVFFLALGVSLVKTISELYSTPLITRSMVKAAVLFYVPVIVEGILLVYIIYYSMYTLQHIQRLVDISLMASAIIALLGILQYFIGGTPPFVRFLFDPEFRFYGRATSVFSNPNDLGGFAALMVTVSLVSFVWGSTGHKKRLFFNLPILLLNMFALILSFSRGGMVQAFLSMLVIGYLYYMKIYRGKLSWKVILLLIAILTTIGLAIRYYDLYMRARIVTRNEADYQRALYYTKAMSDYLRKHVAIRALQTSLKHPLFGIGLNVFAGKRMARVNYFGLATHNQFLKILVEMGLLGFIPFIILLWIVIKTGMNLWKNSREKPVDREVQIMMLLLLSGVSVVAFGYLFTDSLVAISVTGYLWIFSGAIFVLDRQYNRKEEEV